MRQLDKHDVALLGELQRDARQTTQQLAEKVGLSGTPCWKRVKEMEAAGIIRGYTARLDRERIGLHLHCIAEVHLNQHNDEVVQLFERSVVADPHIVNCYRTTGESDYIIHVLVRDIASYERFLQGSLFKLAAVGRVHSSVVLKDVKSEARLPIDAAP